MIEHLSREITTHVAVMMTFRERINFLVWLGPSLVVGGVLFTTRSMPTDFDFDAWAGAAFALLILCYGTMGWACGAIEDHAWKQCNAWREVIARLQRGEAASEKDMRYDNPDLLKVYTVVYAALGVSVVALVILIAHCTFPSIPPGD